MDDMSDWLNRIIDNYNTSNQIDVNHVSQLIQTNGITVEQLVIDLRSYLTSTDTEKRVKGLNILTKIISSLPQNVLSENEVQHLALFYCDRLKDHHSIIPYVFSGLLAISECTNQSNTLSKLIFDSLVKETSVQQYSISERFTVYQLLFKLFHRHSSEFKTFRPEFIYGFIQIIEGERDPRCLLLIFRLTFNIIKTIELEPFTEDLFEVISCYFPVMFSPPPNDEYGITREDLSESLHQCFSASPAFAQYLFPLILEKLESELINAKIDSYKLLQICCTNYGYEKMESYLPQLWTCIRIDCLKPNVSDDELSEQALKALASISGTMIDNNANSDSFFDLIWKDIEPAFLKPELYLMESAVTIIIAIISSNSCAFDKINVQIMPLLLNQFTFSHRDANRVQIIDSICLILANCQNTCPDKLILKNSESLFMLLTALSIAESETDILRISVISCLIQLIRIMNQITEEHWKIIIQVLNSCLNNCFNSNAFMNKANDLLESISLLNPQLVSDKILKPMIKEFDIDEPNESNLQRLNYALNAFECASIDLLVFQLITPHLVKSIKSNSYVIDANQERFSLGLTKCLKNSIDKHNRNENLNDYLYRECFDPLIQHCIHLSICTDNKSSTNVNMKLLMSLFYLIGNGVSGLDKQCSQTLFDKVSNFSLLGQIDKLLGVIPPTCHCSFVNGPKFFDHLTHTQAIIVFGLIKSLVCNLKYESDDNTVIELLDRLVFYSINDNYDNTYTCHLNAESVAAIVNRFSDKNQVLNNKLTDLLKQIEENVNDTDAMVAKKVNYLNLCVWITKGLVISRHELRKSFVGLLIKSLANDNIVIREKASDAFSVIHETDKSMLTFDNNAVVKILYHQSFYFETFEPLLTGYSKYKSEDSDKKQFYMTSLLNQLNFIPKTVFRNELNRLLPMLLEAISCENSMNSQISALESISQILIEKNTSLLNASLRSTITNCINLSLNSQYLKVRSSALNCLSNIAISFDDSDLSQFREQVVRNLRKALNDNKRLVRMNAVRARFRWILVGQPGSN